jgi:hypothetical protein
MIVDELGRLFALQVELVWLGKTYNAVGNVVAQIGD